MRNCDVNAVFAVKLSYINVESIYLFAARIVGQFVIRGHVQILLISIHRIQNDFIADDHVIAAGAQFIERHYVKPRAFVAIGI